MDNILRDRIKLGQCPICKEVVVEGRAVEHLSLGKVTICRKHRVVDLSARRK